MDTSTVYGMAQQNNDYRRTCMQHFTDQDLSPAIIRRILAQRPDLQLFFDALEQLR